LALPINHSGEAMIYSYANTASKNIFKMAIFYIPTTEKTHTTRPNNKQ